MSRQLAGKRFAGRLLAALGGGLLAGSLVAAPEGGVVTAGQGSIRATDASTTTIHQASPSLVIDWNSFDLGAAETVIFRQPSSNAAALNRILDQNPSQILGSINANGRVFLSNPNGLFFGADARVNVGALVATSLDISAADFMRGDYRLQPGAGGAVVNQGIIRAASGGSVALIGNSVSNQGLIVADYGHVALAAGRQAVVDFDGDGLLNFQIDEAVLQNAAGVDDAVHNGGSIVADAGQILLSAQASEDIFTNVINNEGLIQATRMENHGGVIHLSGGAGGRVISSGDIDVNGVNGSGGEVYMLGGQVGLFGEASVDASGAGGGGVVLIGGDYQGLGDIPAAETTVVGGGVVISVDAGDSGEGGRVIVWADGTTQFYGDISARGGESAGDGGFVEVSGRRVLTFEGSVNTSADQGVSGTLLLDPDDITIINDGPGDDDGLLADGSILFADIPADTEISEDALEAVSATTDILLQAVDSITIENLDGNDSLGLAQGTGNSVTFTVSSATGTFSMNNGDRIRILGGGDLTISAATISLGSIDTNGGILTIDTSISATQSGVIGVNTNLGSLIKTGIGSLTLSQTNTYTGETRINQGSLVISGSNRIADASTLVVDGGNFDINNDSDTVGAVTLISGSITGTSGVLTGSSYSVESGAISADLGGAGGLTKTTAGSVSLTGDNTYTGLTQVSAGTLVIGADDVLANASSVTVDGGTLDIGTFDDTVDVVTLENGSIIGTSGVLTGSSYAVESGTVSAILSGAAGLTKTTGGTVTLLGANSYTGLTQVSAGTLVIGANDVLANASSVTVDGGTLDLDTFDDTVDVVSLESGSIIGTSGVLTGSSYAVESGTISAILSGAAGLTKTTGGTVTLSGANSYTGLTQVSAGTLVIGANDVLANASSVTVDGGTLDLDTFDDTVDVVTLESGSIIGTSGVLTGSSYAVESGTISAILSGAAGLTKTTGGTVTLSGANTYSGVTTINAGVLSVATIGDGGVAGNLGAATNLATNLVLDGGTLRYTGASATSDRGITLGPGVASTIELTVNNLTLPGAIGVTDTGGLTKTGAGTLTLSGVNSYTGPTTITSGTLALDATGTIEASSGVANGGTFSIAADKTIDSLSGAGATVLGGILTIGDASNTSSSYAGVASGAGGITKAGTGTLTLTGVNTYTGATTLSAGILEANSSTALGAATNTLVFNGGTLRAGGDIFSPATRAVTLNATGTVDSNGNTVSIAGVITGVGGISKAGVGTLTLSGVNTYTGATTISAGTLVLNATGTIEASSGVANDGSFTIAADKTIDSLSGAGATLLNGILTIGDASNTSSSYAGVASGAGGISKAGTGTLTLTGVSSYTGATTITAGTLLLDATGTIEASSGVANGGTFSIAADKTIDSMSGAGGTVLGGILTIGDASNTNSSYAGAASSTGGISKAGTGTLTLTGVSSYTGATTITAGILEAGSSAALGDGSATNALVFDGGTFRAGGDIVSPGGRTVTLNANGVINTNGNNVTLGGIVSGAQDLAKTGAGTLTLSGVNTYTGATTITAGTLLLDATGTIEPSSGVANGGTFSIAADKTIDSMSGAGGTLLGGILTIGDASNTDTSYAGVFSGAGGIGKAGTGTLTLTGVNTYSGATTISAGILDANASAALGAGGATNTLVFNGGTLRASGDIASPATRPLSLLATAVINSGGNDVAIAGVVSGTGGITKTGAGTLTLTGANNYSGANILSAGILEAGSSAALGDGSVTNTLVFDGGTLRAGGDIVSPGGRTVTLNANGVINTNGNNVTLGGIVSGAQDLAKTGAGTLTLSGVNTYTGATTITAGTLLLDATGTIEPSSGVANGGTFSIAADKTIDSMSGAGGTLLGGILTIGDASNTDTSYAGVFSGAGGISKAGVGTLTLSGVNTYTGATTISAGTLVLNATGTIEASSGVANDGSFTIAADKTIDSLSGAGATLLNGILTIGDASNTSSSYAGVASGAGGISKAGTGTLTLTGVSSYTGATTITAGTLLLDATGTIEASSGVANGGTFSIAADKTIDSLSGAGGTVLGGILTIGDASNTNSSYAGAASGAGGITKAGTGTLTLTGASTYSGMTTLGAGVLVANSSAALGNGSATNSLLFNGGSLRASGNISSPVARSVTLTTDGLIDSNGNNISTAGTISGAGGITKVGAGALTLTGASNYTGATTITAGILEAGSSAALGDGSATNTLVFDGGTLRAGGDIVSPGGRTVTLNANGVINTNGNNVTLGGIVSGAQDLAKTGAGTLTLSGVNTYTGATTITAGTLLLDATGTIEPSSGVANGGTFSIAADKTIDSMSGAGGTLLGGILTIGDASNTDTSYAGVFSGAGGIGKAGTGTLTLTGVNTYSGATTISAGILDANASAALGAGGATNTLVFNGGTLRASGDIASPATRPLSLLATAVINSGGNDVAIAGVVSGTGGITKTGAGTLSLSGVSSYSGETTIVGGILEAGSSAALGDGSVTNSLVFDGGSLRASGNINSPATRAVTLNSDGTFDTSGNNVTVAGVFSGAGSVIKSGTGRLTLSASNNYSGSTTINAGTLRVLSDGALGTATTATLVEVGGILDIRNVAYGTLEGVTLNGGSMISSSGSSSFAGTVNLTADSTFGGGGDLVIGGVVSAPAQVVGFSGNGDKTLGNAANDLNEVILGGAGNVTLVDADALNLSAVSFTGDLDATAILGDISVASIVTSGAVTLAANDGGVDDANGDAVNISSANLVVSSGAGIGDSDALEISTDILSFTSNGNVDLVNSSTTAIAVQGSSAGGDISIRQTTVNGTLDISGPLDSGGGSIDLITDILTGTGSIDAGAGVVTLAGNDITRDISIAGAGVTGNTNFTPTLLSSISTTGGLTIGSLGYIGGITIVDAVSLPNVGGSLSLLTDAEIVVDASLTNSAAMSETILRSNGGDVRVNAALTGDGDISLVANNGSIGFDGPASVESVAGDITLLSGGNIVGTDDISLTGLGLSFNNTVSAAGNILLTVDTFTVEQNITSTGGEIELVSANPIRFNSGITISAVDSFSLTAAGTADGNLTLVSAADDITLSGDLTVANGGDLVLDAAGSVELAVGVLTATGDVEITADDLELDTMIDAVGTVTIVDRSQNGILLLAAGTDSMEISSAELNAIAAEELVLQSGNRISLGTNLNLATPTSLTIDTALFTIDGTRSIALSDATATLDFADSNVDVSGGLTIATAGSFLMNGTLDTTGAVNLDVDGGMVMGLPSRISTTNDNINVDAGGNVLLGLMNAGNADVSIRAQGGDILNNNGVFANVLRSQTNIISQTVSLNATDRIGVSSSDAITLDVDPNGLIDLTFGADTAFVNNLNSTTIRNNSTGLVAVGLVFSSQIIGIGHNVGLGATNELNALNQANFARVEADGTLISILGADFQVLFEEEDEDDIVSSIIPSVPVMVKTLDGWEFVAPTRRQNLDRLRENRNRGERFIDWL